MISVTTVSRGLKSRLKGRLKGRLKPPKMPAAGVGVACGHAHTVAIGAEEGDLWAWGAGDFAQLGLNSREHKALPARVGGREVFSGCRVAQVALRRRPHRGGGIRRRAVGVG